MLTTPDGTRWGTAAELAHHLGVTQAMIRNWAQFDGLPKVRMTSTEGRPEVRYPLLEAADIDRRKRHAKRGRTRTYLTQGRALITLPASTTLPTAQATA